MQLPASEAIAANEASDFSIFEDTVLKKYVGTDSTVVIPDGIQTIATDAFKNNVYVKSVVIPKSVTKIEPYAFWGCALTSVSIGGGLEEIGDYAFANCKSLASITIPENVARIGLYAFEDNISLTEANITYKTMNIHETAFDGCYKLIIRAPEGSYPYKYAQEFYQRQMEFNEYEDVSNFNPSGNGNGSGNADGNGGTGSSDGNSNGGGSNGAGGGDNGSGNGGSSIEFIYNPDGTVSNRTDYSSIINEGDDAYGTVHIVGNQAVVFMDSASPNVYSGNNPPQYDADGNTVSGTDGSASDTGGDSNGSGNGSGTGNGSDMGEGAVDSSMIPKYTIVDGKIVADQAYYCNTSINHVVLPETIEEIGQFAYARSSLSSIVIPNKVERISYGAFYHCDNLNSITLPESVMFVEPNAFAYTAWVENFYNGSGNSDSSDGDFLISGGVLVAYKGSTDTVEIPDGVRSIAADVFENHTEIKKVILPKSVKVIGEEAFNGCTNLADINLDESSVKYILDRAFKDTAIERTVLPSALVALGINAFDDDAVLFYLGSEPETTHEATAERLSNAELRARVNAGDASVYVGAGADNGGSSSTADVGHNVGVTVVGADGNRDDDYGIEAYLEAAQEAYTLVVKNVTSNDILNKAMNRAESILSDRSLINPSIYEMVLTDKSGIEITKLGKVGLTIAIPIPDSINADTKLAVLTVDRNGQLEELRAETVSVEGKKYVRFTTYHLSPFAIYSTGNLLGAEDVIVANETIEAFAAGPMGAQMGVGAVGGSAGAMNSGTPLSAGEAFKNWVKVKKWRLMIAGGCVAAGVVMLAYRKRKE